MLAGLSQWLSGKEPSYNTGDTGDLGCIPGLGRSPEGGHGNPLQYSCLENPMDRGALRATVYRVAKSQLKQLSSSSSSIYINRASQVALVVKNPPANA